VELENNRKEMLKHQDEYYKLTKSAEKQSQNLEKMLDQVGSG